MSKKRKSAALPNGTKVCLTEQFKTGAGQVFPAGAKGVKIGNQNGCYRIKLEGVGHDLYVPRANVARAPRLRRIGSHSLEDVQVAAAAGENAARTGRGAGECPHHAGTLLGKAWLTAYREIFGRITAAERRVPRPKGVSA